MKRLFFLIMLLLALPIGMQADVLHDDLPSNYGNWMNLTKGIISNKRLNGDLRMETAIEDNVIHLLWLDPEKNSSGTYDVWYRRSTDLGKTWESAKRIFSTHVKYDDSYSNYAKFMAVEGSRVHIALYTKDDQDYSRIIYFRSDDAGASFSSGQMFDVKSGTTYSYFKNLKIKAGGGLVAIGALGSYECDLHFLVSSNNGSSFKYLKEVPPTKINDFFDLQVSNGRWVALSSSASAAYGGGVTNGYVYITAGDANSCSSQQVAPVQDDGKPYGYPNVRYYTHNYEPQMAMEGNTVYLMYRGMPANWDDKKDVYHTLFQKSTDGGKTWSKVTDLPDSNGDVGTLAAKGQNIYILTGVDDGRNSLRTIYYSHDGGNTWGKQQTRGNQYNGFPYNYFRFYIDPNDASGKHVYLTRHRFSYLESKDGFETISRNFVLGTEAWYTAGFTNQDLTVMLDKNGTEHWFLQYQKPVLNQYGNGDTDNSSRDICYRRVEPEPAPSGTKALNMRDEKMISHRVVLPMSPSLMLKQAMTVEAWVRTDEPKSDFQIAGTTETDSHNASQYNGGWYLKADDWYGNGGYFEGGLRTDKATDDVGVRAYNVDNYKINKWEKWHHVALTYDASVEKDNVRLYVDGMLTATQTAVGDIRVGANPISFGAEDGYGTHAGLLDHFAMYDRALTAEELRDHIYNRPTGQEKGCVCLLTFDGTLKDMSGHGNDAVALADVDFVEHDGIRVPPEPKINLTKDVTGMYITMSNGTPGSEVDWWRAPYKWDPAKTIYETTPSVKVDFLPSGSNNFSGVYNAWMGVAGIGEYNAYITAHEQFTIGGLNRVEPAQAAQSAGVRMKILGGFNVNHDNPPVVKLHGAGGDITGQWLLEYGDKYDSNKYQTADDAPQALFDLSNAAVGKYDVIVGDDVLKDGFEVVAGGEPDVWMQVNGWDRQLRNKWKDYTIDYGNRSNIPAYNVPIFIAVTSNNGMVDVSFDFDFDPCFIGVSEYGESIAKMLGDHITTYDASRGDSIYIYSFLIPYIGPNTTQSRTFRMRHRFEGNDGGGSENVEMIFWAEEPWGYVNPDDPNPYGARTRAPYTLEQAECFAGRLGQAAIETAIDFIPGGSCVYGILKTGVQSVTDKENRWSTLASNVFGTTLSCVEDLIPPVKIWQMAYKIGSFIWNYGTMLNDLNSCLKGNPNGKNVKGVNSYDPNEMIGPSGYDDQAHYIKPIHNMAYTITYENKATASAPAHEVYVNDRLDASKYDLSTFGFTSFGWADKTWSVGGSRTKEFMREIPWTVNGKEIMVRVSGKFDEKTGEANWSMISLDKYGKEIDDPDLGYLLPNNSNQDGEGFVSFSVEHKPNPANGSTVSNKATIVFDANPAIETNTFVNTFDTDYPTSKVTKAERKGNDIVISFEGSDATSGIASYDLYVFKNGEAELLAAGVTGNQYTMKDAPVNYSFCSIATDHVGWKEPKNLAPEATGIRSIATAEGGAWTVYSVDGKVVAQGKGELPKILPAGVYVVRSGNSTRKVIIQ